MVKRSIYTVGGTVQAGDGLYIPRKADEELLALCRANTFAYVLTARQMGKSSLMVRAAERLADEGITSIIIDLTELGVNITQQEWYLGILTKITDTLALNFDVVAWWDGYGHLGVTQRMTKFFEQLVHLGETERIVLFIDEIDTTLRLPFADDFYAAIRYIHNARATNKDFERLSFVLIGVATPSELISDSHRTPFNIGQRVDLKDFTLAEAVPLAKGLGLPSKSAKQALEWVMKWTGGHPYLSQRLCQAIASQNQDAWSEIEIDKLVEDLFLGQTSEQDQNLQFVRDMLTKRAPNPLDVLTTYREIYLGQRRVLDEKQSIIKSHLKLSGIVRRAGTILNVRNLLYRTVFNIQWVETQTNESPIITQAQKDTLEATTVFIGSCARDLPEHCKEVLDECLRQRMLPKMVEHLPKNDAEAIQFSLSVVDQADIYLGIFAYRYGYVPAENNPRRVSLAEMEYDRAVELKIPRLIFVMDKTHPITVEEIELGEGERKLSIFKKRLLAENTVSFYTSSTDLRAHVINSLAIISREADELIEHMKQLKSFRIQPILSKDEPG
jgi:hypothetical protein